MGTNENMEVSNSVCHTAAVLPVSTTAVHGNDADQCTTDSTKMF